MGVVVAVGVCALPGLGTSVCELRVPVVRRGCCGCRVGVTTHTHTHTRLCCVSACQGLWGTGHNPPALGEPAVWGCASQGIASGARGARV